MVGDPYEATDDPACYPGDPPVLRNLAELRDQDSLDAFEIEMFTLRSEAGLPDGAITPSLYRAIHRHLFQDVYAWAGDYRTIRTGKGSNWFCYPEFIVGQMDDLFRRLNEPAFQPGAAAADFVPALADFIGELNAIHPFREGNGRTQLILVRQLGQQAGNLVRIDAVETDEFLSAMISSFGGDLAPLIDELERMLA